MKRNRLGCLIVGLLWATLLFFTNLMLALGDPVPVDCTGLTNCVPYPTRWIDFLLTGEVLLLVAIGWFFYRREMKDGEF